MSDSQAHYAAVHRYTTRRSDTHNTVLREIRYPWYGRQVTVFETILKQGMPVLRCALEPTEASRSIEVPQWMFDVVACQHLRVLESPVVSLGALFELKQLLSKSLLEQPTALMQAVHHSLSNIGGAHAAIVEPASSATQSVPTVASRNELGGFAEGDSTTEPATASPIVAPAELKTSHVHSRQGGNR